MDIFVKEALVFMNVKYIYIYLFIEQSQLFINIKQSVCRM